MAYHVGKAEFAQLVEEALRDLPEQFASFLEEVPIEIRDRPSRRQLRDLEMDEDSLLLGLYVGTSLKDRSVAHGVEMPNVIFLFQDDIEEVSDNAEQLKHEVRTTVLHEIGHHFGLDEDDLERLGYG